MNKKPPSPRSDVPAELDHASELKEKLINFGTGPHFAKELAQECLLEFGPQMPASETVNFIDWFILEWKSKAGKTVIDAFLEETTDLSESDRDIVAGWKNVVDSLFEILELKEDGLVIRDVDSEKDFFVRPTVPMTKITVDVGHAIEARIIPYYDYYIFSGVMFHYPSVEDAIRELSAEDDQEKELSPEALLVQQEQAEAFKQLFGSDELIGSARDIQTAMQRFIDFFINEYHFKDAGKTLSQLYREQNPNGTLELQMPSLEEDFEEGINYGVIFDGDAGIVILPKYDVFTQIFSEPDFTAVPDYEDLFWNYLQESTIPEFVFRRMAGRYPDHFEQVFRQLLEEPEFTIENDLDSLLQTYKGFVNLFDDDEDIGEEYELWEGEDESDEPSLLIPETEPDEELPPPADPKKAKQKAKKAREE